MGAWTFVEPYLEWVLGQIIGFEVQAPDRARRPLPASASPATGLMRHPGVAELKNCSTTRGCA